MSQTCQQRTQITAIRWTCYIKPLIYFGSFGALGGFAFWVALIWCGTFESDFFNPSITRFPRTKDGGFGAAARADQLSHGGCAGQNGITPIEALVSTCPGRSRRRSLHRRR